MYYFLFQYKLPDQLIQRHSLCRKLLAGCGRFFRCRGIRLHNLGNLGHTCLRLLHGRRHICGNRAQLFGRFCNLLDAIHNLLDGIRRALRSAVSMRDLLQGTLDQLSCIHRGLRTLICQLADLIRNDGKAASGLACSRRLNRSVEG